jgi:hypothetical protein
MKCCYCSKDLHGGYIEAIPAWDNQILWREDADARYCSAECLRKRVGELFIRTKLPDERWPRFTVEVPPELAVLLDSVQKHALGVNRSTRVARGDRARRAEPVPGGHGQPASARDRRHRRGRGRRARVDTMTNVEPTSGPQSAVLKIIPVPLTFSRELE